MIFVLYHANCQDGLGAKYAAWKKFGDGGAVYMPVQYGQKIPDAVFGTVMVFSDLRIGDQFYDPATNRLFCKDTDKTAGLKFKEETTEDLEWGMSFPFEDDEAVYRSNTHDVYICDFSYPREALERLRLSVNTLVVLDHHKTAQEALDGFPGAIFDMNRSGAMIAWDYFHPAIKAPKLLEYVQDRDLWKKQFPETDIIAGAIPLLEGDMQKWNSVVMEAEELQNLYKKGQVIDQYKKIKVQEGLKAITVLPYRGYKAGVRNYTDNPSDIGEAIYLTEGIDIAMTYFVDTVGNVVVSFRSNQNGGPDVGALAKELGGGGHKNASGARVDFNFLSKLLAGQL
jgi:uncharacterized protein